MDFTYVLNQEELRLLRRRAQLTEQLSSFPEGEICFHKNGSRIKWRVRYDDHVEYLPKEQRDLAEKLAMKKFVQDQLAHVERKLKALQAVKAVYEEGERQGGYPESFYELLQSQFQREQEPSQLWRAEEYESNPDHPERRNIATLSGIMVRSKSEAVIADALYRANVPFRYEQAMVLGGVTYYPDFVIWNADDPEKPMIWEHFGMMDSIGYAQRAKQKIGAYLDAGYIPTQNLILTYESREEPLDVNHVSLLVGYYFT